jgi:hypothetical protein
MAPKQRTKFGWRLRAGQPRQAQWRAASSHFGRHRAAGRRGRWADAQGGRAGPGGRRDGAAAVYGSRGLRAQARPIHLCAACLDGVARDKRAPDGVGMFS